MLWIEREKTVCPVVGLGFSASTNDVFFPKRVSTEVVLKKKKTHSGCLEEKTDKLRASHSWKTLASVLND